LQAIVGLEFGTASSGEHLRIPSVGFKNKEPGGALAEQLPLRPVRRSVGIANQQPSADKPIPERLSHGVIREGGQAHHGHHEDRSKPIHTFLPLICCKAQRPLRLATDARLMMIVITVF
jgi:hypothetical protein